MYFLLYGNIWPTQYSGAPCGQSCESSPHVSYIVEFKPLLCWFCTKPCSRKTTLMQWFAPEESGKLCACSDFPGVIFLSFLSTFSFSPELSLQPAGTQCGYVCEGGGGGEGGAKGAKGLSVRRASRLISNEQDSLSLLSSPAGFRRRRPKTLSSGPGPRREGGGRRAKPHRKSLVV